MRNQTFTMMFLFLYLITTSTVMGAKNETTSVSITRGTQGQPQVDLKRWDDPLKECPIFNTLAVKHQPLRDYMEKIGVKKVTPIPKGETVSNEIFICEGKTSDVAVKCIRAGVDDYANAENEVRFQNMAAVNDLSPRIEWCKPRDGEDSIMIMPKLGKTLKEYLQEHPDRLERTVGIIFDKCVKLTQLGILHNDLHDSNIMLNAKGEFKIIDFGISKDLPDEEKICSETGMDANWKNFIEKFLQVHFYGTGGEGIRNFDAVEHVKRCKIGWSKTVKLMRWLANGGGEIERSFFPKPAWPGRKKHPYLFKLEIIYYTSTSPNAREFVKKIISRRMRLDFWQRLSAHKKRHNKDLWGRS